MSTMFIASYLHIKFYFRHTRYIDGYS